MIIHTLVYSFPAEMTDNDRDEFFHEVASIMLNRGHAQKVEYRPHLRLPADDHAPVFIASDISQVTFPDLDALAATSALPAMHEFMAKWQQRYPYQVVWVNHEPIDL